MDAVDVQVLRKADAWQREGHRVVLGTVARTWGSAPRPAGALVAIRDDGRIAGSVSGGCIEDDLVDKVRTRTVAAARPQRVTYGVNAEEAFRFGLPCGGSIELVLEPVTADTHLAELLQRIESGRRTRRTLDLATGRVELEDGPQATLSIDEHALVSIHGPQQRLLIIGAGQMAHYLAQMAVALDYQVIVCDPRAEYADGWQVPGTECVRTMPDDTVVACRPDSSTAIVALTHDPKLDDMALMEALKSDAFYVGAIGSQRNQDKRKARLLTLGLTAEQLDRLHGPVGLKNGARTPAEIGVSILAELTAAKYGYRIATPVPPLAGAPTSSCPSASC